MSLLPDYFFHRITDITPAFLLTRGVKGLVLDIDNTLTFDGQNVLPGEVAHWLGEIKDAGIKAIIVSNNHERRGRDFAALCDLPFVAKAFKPSQKTIAAVLKVLAPPGAVAVIGDQLFTDILYGKRAGFITVLVEKMGSDLPFFVKMKRVAERPAMRKLRRNGYTKL